MGPSGGDDMEGSLSCGSLGTESSSAASLCPLPSGQSGTSAAQVPFSPSSTTLRIEPRNGQAGSASVARKASQGRRSPPRCDQKEPLTPTRTYGLWRVPRAADQLAALGPAEGPRARGGRGQPGEGKEAGAATQPGAPGGSPLRDAGPSSAAGLGAPGLTSQTPS